MNKRLLLVILPLLLLVGARLAQSAADAPPPAVAAAQSRWQEVQSYRFSATLDQERIPQPSVTTVGQQGRRQQFYFDGQAWPGEGRMEASIWAQGGDVTTGQGKMDLRMENGRTWVHAGCEPQFATPAGCLRRCAPGADAGDPNPRYTQLTGHRQPVYGPRAARIHRPALPQRRPPHRYGDPAP